MPRAKKLRKTYGSWRIVDPLEERTYETESGRRIRYVLAECKCGRTEWVRPDNLTQGKTLRCMACYQLERKLGKAERVMKWLSGVKQ